MRKHVEHTPAQSASSLTEETWIDLDRAARVQITSEAEGFPIESALVPGEGPGWQAAESGPQTLRLHFDEVQKITRVRVAFTSSGQPRTQEFALRWSGDGGASYHDVVRQQFNFSPPSTTVEEENYRVDLIGVTDLELTIVPDVSGGSACASLKELRLS